VSSVEFELDRAQDQTHLSEPVRDSASPQRRNALRSSRLLRTLRSSTWTPKCEMQAYLCAVWYSEKATTAVPPLVIGPLGHVHACRSPTAPARRCTTRIVINHICTTPRLILGGLAFGDMLALFAFGNLLALFAVGAAVGER